MDTSARPDSPKKKCIPGSTHQLNAADSAATCVAARLGGTYRKVPGRLRKVTDTVTTDAPVMGQVGSWTRRTSPHSEQCSAPPISPHVVETAYRPWPTAQPGHAGGRHWPAVPRRPAGTRGVPPVAGGAPMPASARVSSAHRSVPSKSTPPGGAPSNTVITQSWQARPRAAQQSQSTIMLAPFR